MIQTIIGQNIHNNIFFESHLRELLNDNEYIQSKALIAFATLNGVLSIGAAVGGELFHHVNKQDNSFKWIVGVDSITSADALRTLRELGNSSVGDFYLRAFESSTGLFHPKIFIFKKADGTGTVLIGSNNLTSGGLRDNIEVSVRLDELTEVELQQWEELWDLTNSKTESIKEITDDLLHTLQEIRRRDRITRRRVRRQTEVTFPVVEDMSLVDVDTTTGERRILIREVPRAGDRVHQVHFTLDIADHYFGFREEIGPRQVRLQQVQPNSSPSQVEHRRLVLSSSNRNAKVEVGGARILLDNYPENARPILVFEQIETDFFRYMLLLPGDDGFHELSSYLGTLPRGRALPYRITDINELLEIWSDYPI